MVTNPGQTHNMVSDNVMNDPGTSSAPPPPTLEETLRGMMLELQQVRAANEVLHSQMQGLLAQAPAQQQPILPHNVDWRPACSVGTQAQA